MSSFWSWWIIVISLANIFACFWLIRWTAKRRPGEAASTDTTGHVWDGDLREYNNPMPRWWLFLFYITIIFALVYLVLFPGLGNFKGLLGWSQVSEYRSEMQQAKEKYAPLYDKYAQIAIPELAGNHDAMATAGRIFANNCAVCHGSDAGGAPGFPNLTDNDWLHGGSPEAIQQTIMNGRQGNMPAWGQALGDRGVQEVATYVYSLNGRSAPKDLVEAGRARFQQMCIACHGADAKGNQAIGAPNLTDDTWLYGGDLATIEETIRNGRNGKMPAWKDRLGPEKAHLMAAYVYSLSHEGGNDEQSK